MRKCDKNGVISVSIYTNVKYEILVFISVENIVVQLNGLLYISSYITGAGNYQQPQLPSANMADADLYTKLYSLSM